MLDPASDKIVAEIPTGVSPHFVDLFDGTKLGLVVEQGPGQLLLFDPETNKEVRSIAVGKKPHWAALSGDGKTAYVTNEGSNDVSVVDLESGKASTIAVGQVPRKFSWCSPRRSATLPTPAARPRFRSRISPSTQFDYAYPRGQRHLEQ